MNLQAMMDGMSAQWQKERAESQMTLGKLIERLESLPPETMLDLAEPHSYRGYYSDLAFEKGDEITAAAALTMCRAAMGEVFQGYKGGDFQMGRNTPVWRASYGCCGQKIMGVRDDGTLELADDE
jgi:hypothetical protein